MEALIPLVLVGLLMMGVESRADSMFYDNCVGQQTLNGHGHDEGGYEYVLVSDKSGFFGMSCQDLKSAVEGAQNIGMVLMPASRVLKLPGVKEEITAGLADLGLAAGGTAVVSVTLFGSLGFVTVYFIMKRSMKECQAMEKQQLKQDLIREIQKNLRTPARGDAPLEIRADGDAA